MFFGSPDQTLLVAPFAGLMGATSAFYVAFGWFRGRVRMRAAALIQVAGFALVPPGVVLALPGRPVDELIAWMAALLGALSVAAVAAPLVRGVRARRRARAGEAAGTLFTYGHRRVPGSWPSWACSRSCPRWRPTWARPPTWPT